MASPVPSVSSPSVLYPNLTSTAIPAEPPATPSSYISLSETNQSPDPPLISGSQRTTLHWTRTFDTLRQWSTRTFKVTRQIIQERFGQTMRTQDKELEQKIELLRDTKRRYEVLLKEARQMAIHFAGFLQAQRSLGETFGDLQQISTSSDDLVDELVRNSECQKVLARNGDTLLSAMNGFISTLHTLVTKTMEDTMMTIRAYESARVEFDAHRYDFEALLERNHATGRISSFSETEEFIQRQYYHFKERYERLRDDVTIKVKLLDENRIKVMKEQLALFHNAIGAYFSINRQQLNL